MTHSAPQSRRSPRGCYRKTWGDRSANPTSGRGWPGPEGPAPHRTSARSWHQASARPPYPLTWHRSILLACGPPPALPWPSLTRQPWELGAAALPAERRAWLARAASHKLVGPSSAPGMGAGGGPSRPAHPSDPISAGPRHASGIHCAPTTAQDRELGEQPDEGQDQLSAPVRPQQREAFWKVLWRRKRLCPRPLLPWASSDPAGPAS